MFGGREGWALLTKTGGGGLRSVSCEFYKSEKLQNIKWKNKFTFF